MLNTRLPSKQSIEFGNQDKDHEKEHHGYDSHDYLSTADILSSLVIPVSQASLYV